MKVAAKLKFPLSYPERHLFAKHFNYVLVAYSMAKCLKFSLQSKLKKDRIIKKP